MLLSRVPSMALPLREVDLRRREATVSVPEADMAVRANGEGHVRS